MCADVTDRLKTEAEAADEPSELDFVTAEAGWAVPAADKEKTELCKRRPIREVARPGACTASEAMVTWDPLIKRNYTSINCEIITYTYVYVVTKDAYKKLLLQVTHPLIIPTTFQCFYVLNWI